MISKGKKSEEYVDISQINEADIAGYYLGIKSIPCLINSPLRKDEKPSFSIYSRDGNSVHWKDFSTGESGDIIDLLSKLWNCSVGETFRKIKNDLGDKVNIGVSTRGYYKRRVSIRSSKGNDLQCRVREWRDYDIEYWNSYGIPIEWLKYANVYPISHKIIVKDNVSFAFGADKYAYAFVEFKEGQTTIKIYQPFNKNGFKWANRHDKSVISLWTKVPAFGERVCICSSLKDALCLWANTGIPALATQGEGYSISTTAANELSRRFKKVYICFDNDSTGLKDAKKLSKTTGFTNVVLPKFEGGKDISDFFKVLQDKQKFKQQILKLFT